jgi:putative ABC transport system substrate-binding protein
MRRRDFLTVLGGTAATWPLAARAQAKTPVIGWLNTGRPQDNPNYTAAFHQGLKDAGFIEGQNLAIEHRWAEYQYDRLPALAAELVARKVAVLAAPSSETIKPAKAATSTIPIVFVTGGDPVRLGYVPSLSRPGGNVTGASFLSTDTIGKRIELLHELRPEAEKIGFLATATSTDRDTPEAQAAAHALNLRLEVLQASNENEIDTAFKTFNDRKIGGLLIGGANFFSSRIEKLAMLAASYKIPAIYSLRDFAIAGGLMTYNSIPTDAYRIAGLYTGRILKGEKPADLPVQEGTRVELVINLKAAKALGITFPLTLLGRADEVIE